MKPRQKGGAVMTSGTHLTLNVPLSLIIQAKRTGKGRIGNGRRGVRADVTRVTLLDAQAGYARVLTFSWCSRVLSK